MRKLRIGVIGAGSFAKTCHIPGLQSHPQAEVVVLCGRRYDHARNIADQLNVPEVMTDFREVCARSDLDALTIAAPNMEHAAVALAALAEGKHVFCEKPLGMTVAEARNMLRAGDASGKIHQVAFTFRYGYGIRELKRRVHQGDIGEPYYVRIQYDGWDGLKADWQTGWREKQALAGGGVLFDVGSHLFDIVRYILGPIDMVSGFLHRVPRQRMERESGKLANVETDDLAVVSFCHDNGVHGQWFFSRVSPKFAENGYVEVIGPQGALKASLSRGTVDVLKVSVPADPEWKELRLAEEAYDGQSHCLGRMMRSFVDACLRGKLDADEDASFDDGLAAQRGLAAVIQSQQSYRWVALREAQ